MYVHSCVCPLLIVCVCDHRQLSVCFCCHVCVCLSVCVFMNMHALLKECMTVISARACLKLVWRDRQKQRDGTLSWLVCTMTHTHTHAHGDLPQLCSTWSRGKKMAGREQKGGEKHRWVEQQDRKERRGREAFIECRLSSDWSHVSSPRLSEKKKTLCLLLNQYKYQHYPLKNPYTL